jgi:hypothetical protein
MGDIIKQLLEIFILSAALSGCAYEITRPVVTESPAIREMSVMGCQEKHNL